MRYDCLFVGAGPANLAAANLLLERGITNIIILEEGDSLNRRGCPGQRQTLCAHCNGNRCHVTGGEGGCSALFGNKLCYFPASNRILDYFSEHIVADSFGYLDALLGQHFNSRFNSISTHTLTLRGDGSPVRKNYTSDVLLQPQFQYLIRKLLSRPLLAGTVRLNKEVAEITKPTPSTFRIVTRCGAVIESGRVVLGCGRSSHAFLRRAFASLGIQWHENCQDVGLRLEAPSEFFTDEYAYQADPKYKFTHPGRGTSRTFCACNGGAIVPVKFGHSYYAEGAFGGELTERNNIAFMVRATTPTPIHELERWCAAVNAASCGTLLLGSVPLNAASGSFVSAIMKLIPYWPSDDHRVMMAELLTLTLGGNISLLRRSEKAGSVLRVYGPAIDLYWPQPDLTKSLETRIHGLYLLGDAAGVSRGFVQSMVSGAAWALIQLADEFVKSPGEGIRREAKKWFVSA